MAATVLTARRPAHVRDIAGVTTRTSLATFVRVGTRDDWLRLKDEFFVWYDRAKDRAKFAYDSDVAKAAGLSHTSISGWRSGRQRPNAQSLSAVARALGVPAKDAWFHAGLMSEADLAGESEPEAPYGPDQWGVDIIETNSNLDPAAKARLIAIFLEQERRDREEKERRLREQINLVSGT
jgi:transcriptional regulator with XRE-family HTH domain